jgi:hypothetical protein
MYTVEWYTKPVFAVHTKPVFVEWYTKPVFVEWYMKPVFLECVYIQKICMYVYIYIHTLFTIN